MGWFVAMNSSTGPSDAEAQRIRRQLRRRGFAESARRFARWLASPFVALGNVIGRIAAYLAQASERSLRRLLAAVAANPLLQFLFGRGLRRAVMVVAGFAGLVALVIDNVFIVPVADNAVILRLGGLARTVGPGLAFKAPFVEQKYFVNTQTRLQENFGFLQYTPPLKPRPERQVDAIEYGAEAAEQALGGYRKGLDSGLITDQLQRTPLLPRDYLVSINPLPPEAPDPQAETKEVAEHIEMQHEALENIIPPDGKVPVPDEMQMLTGDLNIVYVTWSVQYEIVDARQYLFGGADVTEILRSTAIVAMRTAIGDRLDSELLSRGRQKIEEEVKRFLEEALEGYQLGLSIKEVIILDANPPDEVQAAFHMVNQAKQEMEREINRAQTEYNSIVPQSYGQAKRLLSEARAYSMELRNRSVGEAARFSAILKEYRSAPDVTRDRYYIEAMEDVYSRTSVTLIDTDLKGILPVFEGRGSSALANPAEAEMAALQAQAAKFAPAVPPVEPIEPVEQPARLPHSTAVRKLPWEPQPTPALAPVPTVPLTEQNRPQDAAPVAKKVTPVGQTFEAPPGATNSNRAARGPSAP